MKESGSQTRHEMATEMHAMKRIRHYMHLNLMIISNYSSLLVYYDYSTILDTRP